MTYYTTAHHRNYPWVLARISKLHPDAVDALVQMAWRSVARTKRRGGQL